MGDYVKFTTPKLSIKAIKLEEILPARCAVTGDDFDIALGYDKGQLTMISGKMALEGARRAETPTSEKELKKLDLKAGLFASRTYHCPACGNKDIVRCGKCHRITCYDKSGLFQCGYCGNSGTVSGTMDSVDVYNRCGLKKDEIKPDIEYPKYYPGNK